jgi:septal ring factor EnvC (AmiA/AmiB activator)
LSYFFSYKAGFSELSFNEETAPLEQDSTIEETIAHLQKENTQLKRKSLSMERHYHIQVESNKNLTLHIKKLQQNNAELSRDIALYQSLAGSLPGKGIHINTFQIFATEDVQKFRYFFILAKNASQSLLKEV